MKPAKAGETVIDKMTIALDSDYMVDKGKDNSVPLERQKVQGDTETLNCNRPYNIDDGSKRMTYYAKTDGGSKNPVLKIVNNTIKTIGAGNTIDKAPVFPEYAILTKQGKSLEEYSKKITMGYDTPMTTPVEKQFQNTATIESNNNKYAITTTFTIPGKSEALKLTLPITYTE